MELHKEFDRKRKARQRKYKDARIEEILKKLKIPMNAYRVWIRTGDISHFPNKKEDVKALFREIKIELPVDNGEDKPKKVNPKKKVISYEDLNNDILKKGIKVVNGTPDPIQVYATIEDGRVCVSILPTEQQKKGHVWIGGAQVKYTNTPLKTHNFNGIVYINY